MLIRPYVKAAARSERLGFRMEGTRRQAELVDGRYLDSVVYAMLAADFASVSLQRPAP